MKNLVNFLKKSAPSFAQQCPFKGRLEIQNFSLDLKYFKFFPNGEYMNIIRVHDKIDKNIFTITYRTKLDNNK